MNRFSIKDAAFSGYRLLAAQPMTAIFWFLFSLAISVITVVATVVMAGPQLAAIQEMKASGSPDPATMMHLTSQLGPYSAFGMLFPLLTSAITMGAAARAVLRPRDRALGYLRFGKDEFRLIVTTLVITLLILLAYFLTFAMVMVAIAATAGPKGLLVLNGQGSLPPKAIVASCLAAVPGVALLTYLTVKLSLAPAQTVGERAIRIFNSWGMTKGIFWRVLATYLLAALPVVVLGLVLGGITLAVRPSALAGNFNQLMQAMQPDYSTMATAFAGIQPVLYLLQAALNTLAMAAFFVPASAIYAAIAGMPADGADDDDDEDDED